jgi:hypothetical protein
MLGGKARSELESKCVLDLVRTTSKLVSQLGDRLSGRPPWGEDLYRNTRGCDARAPESQSRVDHDAAMVPVRRRGREREQTFQVRSAPLNAVEQRTSLFEQRLTSCPGADDPPEMLVDQRRAVRQKFLVDEWVVDASALFDFIECLADVLQGQSVASSK